MKVDKTLTRLASSRKNHDELSRVGRALANELPRHRMDVLRDFRTKLASMHMEAGEFADGYVASMLDITAEYEVHLGQVEDQHYVARAALRDGWREALELLSEGPRLPSDIATQLGRDRPSVTRMLKRMRMAGLAESFAADSLDGRMRPQRLTLQGRRLLEQLQKQSAAGPLSEDMARGISLAVSLFHRLASKPASTPSELGSAIGDELSDDAMAREAIRVWTQESIRVGLMAKNGTRAALPAPSATAAADLAEETEENPIWQRIPAILSALEEYRDEDTPIYVRTDDSAWGAWAYALQQDDASGGSRTIVRGDILARSLTPPDRRFSLVYDNPEAIGADLQEPAMREFLERAHNKFVIAEHGQKVPEGFIPLSSADAPVEDTGRGLAAHGSDKDE